MGKFGENVLVICVQIIYVVTFAVEEYVMGAVRERRSQMLDGTWKKWAVPLTIFEGLLLQKWIDVSYTVVVLELGHLQDYSSL